MAKKKHSITDYGAGGVILLAVMLGVGGFGAYKIYKNKKAKDKAAKLTTGA